MEQEKKAIHFLVEFDDGTYLESESANEAEGVWKWFGSCESMSFAHGASYPGPYLKVKKNLRSLSEEIRTITNGPENNKLPVG